MDPELLRVLLPSDYSGDLPALWSRYADEEADPNPYGFVTWLFHEGEISGKAARDALTSGRAVLTIWDDPNQMLELPDGPTLEPLGVIGRGAMGEVMVVRDRALRRTIALKRSLAGADASDSQRAAFLTEAQITAQLDHPSIVSVHGFEAREGQMAYTMQLVHGSTLQNIIDEAHRQAREPQGSAKVNQGLDERLHMFLAVCDAMAYAHEQGVVHRDLKPENIMVASHGEVMVMDWGIARLMPQTRGEQEVPIVGTPFYMSPEQAFGAPFALEPASDQYALGLILYELVTLQKANPGKEPLECILAARKGLKNPIQPPPGSSSVPRELRAIIGKATARKPHHRYPNVTALAQDLRRFLRDEEVVAAPDKGLRKVERWISHHRDRALLIGLSLVLLIVVTGLGLTALAEARLAEAEAEALEREEVLRHLGAITSRQVRKLNAQLHSYEAVVAGMTYAAEDALTRSAPTDVPLWGIDEEYTPNDLKPSSFYKAGVSLSEVDLNIAAGVPRDAVEEQLHQLNTLSTTLRAAFVRGSGISSSEAPVAALAQLREKGMPLVWTYVATQAGVIANFPGTDGGYPDDYDHREQGWYQIATEDTGPLWGVLQADESNMGLLLTVSQGLRDEQGTFLGVAALDVALPYLIDNYLDPPELKDVVEAFLVGRDGMVIIRSSEATDAFEADTYEPRPFPYLDQLPQDGLASRSAGWRTFETAEGVQEIVWRSIESVDWWYVVVGDRDALFDRVRELLDQEAP